jgi:hypothetical protein
MQHLTGMFGKGDYSRRQALVPGYFQHLMDEEAMPLVYPVEEPYGCYYSNIVL